MSDRAPAPPALGMFGVPPAVIAQGPVAVGVRPAIDGFLSALLAHGTRPVEVFCSRADRDAVAADLAIRPQPRGRRVRIHETRVLQERLDELGVAAWHHPWNEGARPYRLREARAMPSFPITFTDHCAAHQRFLEAKFLPLVLADTRPYDAAICLSRPARAAVRRTLDHVAGQLADRLPRGARSPFRFRGRIEVVPLGIDTELFRPRQKRALRRRLDLPLDAFLVLFPGRLSASDKADLLPLLLAFRDVVERHPGRDLRLVAAGTSRWRFGEMLLHFAKQLGLSGRVELRRLEPAHLTIAAADVVVSPADSIQETFGLVPVEAMACGIPQVVSDWDGYRETVVHGETGFLLPTAWAPCDRDAVELALLGEHDTFLDQLCLSQSVAVSVPAMREALDALVASDDLRARMARASRRRAVAEFSWPTMIGRLEALWAELAEAARRDRRKPGQSGAPRARRPPTPPGGARGAPGRPAYFETFRGYPSRVLTENEPCALSERGARVLRGDEPLPAYLGDLGILDFDVVETAMKELAAQSRSVPLGELTRRLTASAGISLDRARRHAMWLLKYDLAELRGRRR